MQNHWFFQIEALHTCAVGTSLLSRLSGFIFGKSQVWVLAQHLATVVTYKMFHELWTLP